MNDTIVCPFYAKGEKYCDVGSEYISPHDVNMIIKFCSCKYHECIKYQELTDRYPQKSLQLSPC
jgi:hypothetical protein